MKLLNNSTMPILERSADIKTYEVHYLLSDYSFLHEAAIIEYHGILFASWYNNHKTELPLVHFTLNLLPQKSMPKYHKSLCRNTAKVYAKIPQIYLSLLIFCRELGIIATERSVIYNERLY